MSQFADLSGQESENGRIGLQPSWCGALHKEGPFTRKGLDWLAVGTVRSEPFSGTALLTGKFSGKSREFGEPPGATLPSPPRGISAFRRRASVSEKLWNSEASGNSSRAPALML